MLAQKRLLLSLAALTAAGLAGCLNSTDPSSSQFAPVTESEIAAALRMDSASPVRPRPIVCDTLKARLAAMDTTAPQYPGFSNAVMHVCAVRPVRPDSTHPDTLHPDTLRPDSVKPRPPMPPRPDSVMPLPPYPPRPDSVRQDFAHARPDSLKPTPPKRPVTDTGSAG